MTDDHAPCVRLGDNVLYPLSLRDGGTLLIDAGPDIAGDDGQEDTWNSLVAQLAAHGVEVGDVRLVLVTHAHLDHAGLAYRWADAGATVIAGAADLGAIVLGQASREAQRALQFADLRRHGCPPEIIDGMRSSRGRHPYGLRWEPCPEGAVARAEPSYALADGHTLRVIDAPGHTPGNVVAFIAASGVLFSGDTILPTTIPTPGMHYPEAVKGIEDASRWPSLPPFIESVSRIRRLPIERVHPGHGELVADPDRLFRRFERHHASRARRVRAALDDGPLSAYGVAKRLFPRIPPRRLGQAVTEVLGHLDLLVEGHAAEREAHGDEFRYRLLGRSAT